MDSELICDFPVRDISRRKTQRCASMISWIHFVPNIRPMDNFNNPSPMSLIKSEFLSTCPEYYLSIEESSVPQTKHYTTPIKRLVLAEKKGGDESPCDIKRKRSILERLTTKRKNTLK